jgi:phosphatidylserine synthase
MKFDFKNLRVQQALGLLILLALIFLAQQLSLSNPRLEQFPKSRPLHTQIPLVFGGVAIFVYVVTALATKKTPWVALIVLAVMLLSVCGFLGMV